MKKILFCLFGIMLSLDALSQNVCIELSVHWQLEKDIFKEDSIVNTPFLHITYKNNSNENIYFKKLPLPDSLGLPTPGWLAEYYYLPSEDTINWLKKVENAIKISESTVENNYRVNLGSFRSCDSGWNIYNEISDTCTVIEIDLINKYISDIHGYIYYKKNTKKCRELPISNFQIKKEDFFNYNILDAYKNYFVFLKSNESYTDKYNLVAFQLIKGNFTFGIGENIIDDYVYIESIFDEIQDRYIAQSMKLPDKIGEYNLYYGSFDTNKIVICFVKSK